MKQPLTIALAVTLAALLGIFAMQFLVGWKPLGPIGGELERPAGEVAAEEPGAQEGSPVDDAERERVESPTEAAQQSRLAEAGAALLTGVVLDVFEKPVALASVHVGERPGATFNFLDFEYADVEHEVTSVLTDEDGSFSVSLPTVRPYLLRVTADGFCASVVEPAFAGQHVVIALARGAELSGHVTRADDDTPVANAKVHYFHGPGEDQEGFARTDANGAYRIASLHPGGLSVQIIPEREATTNWVNLECEPGARLVQDFEVEDGLSLAGTIRDAVTKEPIAGAEVSGWSFLHKTVRTDAAGEFLLTGMRRGRPTTVAVRAKGYVRRDFRGWKVGERADWELQPGRTVHGRVVTPDGQIVPDAYVAAVRITDEFGVDWLSTRSDDEGRYSLRGLPPDLACDVYGHKPGFAPDELRASKYAENEDPVKLPDLVLAPPCTVEGVVVTPDGSPVPVVTVRFSGPERGPSNATYYLRTRDTSTDARGRFAMGDLAPGDYGVHLSSPGRQTVDHFMRLAVGARVEDLRLVMSGTISFFGTVVDPDGEPLEGVNVTVRRQADERTMRMRRASTAADGAFRIDNLSEIPYEVSAGLAPDWNSIAEFAPFHLDAVTPANAPYEIRLARLAGRVSGVVQSSEGAPVGRAVVFLATEAVEGATPRHAVLADANGRFTISVPDGATVELRARRTGPIEEAGHTLTVTEIAGGRYCLDATAGEARLQTAPGSTGVVLVLEN